MFCIKNKYLKKSYVPKLYVKIDTSVKNKKYNGNVLSHLL